jgi:hypothetical protein
MTISTGTATVGSITIAGTTINTALSFSGTGNLNISSTLGAGTTFTAGTGTVNYNAAGSQTVQSSYAYNSLSLSGSGVKTAGGNLIVNGSLTTAAGCTLDMSTFTLTGSLTTVTNGGTIKTSSTTNPPLASGANWGGSGLVEYAVLAGGQFVPAGTFFNLKFDNTSAINTAVGNVVVNGILTIPSGGTLNMSTFTLTGTLATVTNGGTIKTSSTTNPSFASGLNWGSAGLIEYAVLTCGQFVPVGTFFNLKFDNTSGTNTSVGNLTVNGALTTTSGGTLDLSTFTLGGILATITNPATIKLSNTSGTPVPTGKTWGGTVNYAAASGSQTVMAGTYNILTLSNTSGTNIASGNLATTTLNNASGGILDMVGFTLTGAITNTSSTIRFSGATNGLAVTTGTIDYNGTGQTVATGIYNNLKLSNSTGTNTAGNNLTVNGILTTTAGGTFDLSTFTLGGTLPTVTNGGTIKTSNTSGTPIPTGKTWGGTVNYAAATSQTVSSGTYSNLILSGGGAKTTTSVTVSNVLSIEGTATTSGTVPGYGSTATLQYKTSDSRTAIPEWITPITATGGVVIASPNPLTITMDADKVLGNSAPLTINSGATLITNNHALTFGGNFTNNGTFTNVSSPITIAGTASTQSISGFTTTGLVSMTKSSGTVTFLGNVNGAGLTINGVGGILNLGAALTHIFTGDITITNGTLDNGSSTTNVHGNLSNAGVNSGTRKIDLTGGSSQHSISGAGTYSNIELNDVNGTSVNSDIILSSLTITSGIFYGNSDTITVTGSGLAWNDLNHSFDYGTSIINMQGTSAQSMYGSTLINLIINNSGAGVTLTDDYTITHMLKLNNGWLILNGHKLTIDPAAVIDGHAGNFNNNNSNYIVTGTGDYLVQYVASSDVIYPIGTASSFTPATLNNTGGTPDNYGVYVVTSTAHTLDFSGVVDKQWTVQEGSANLSNLIMTFQWNAPSNEGTIFQPATTAPVGIWGGVLGPNLDVVDHNLTIYGTNPGPRSVTMDQVQDMDFSGSNARTYAVGNTEALPVELSSFTSNANGRNVSLNWETKTEKNSDKFVIERTKTDAVANTLNWESITSVKAAVLSNSPKQYLFTDKNLQAGKYQYRLKMIDNDGTFAYSKVVEVEITLPKNFELSQNYPNPFNPTTKINYSLPNDSRVTLKVYNIIGERVAQLVNEEQSAGYYVVNFGSSYNKNITSGIYIYKLTAEDITGKSFSSIKKMMLLK